MSLFTEAFAEATKPYAGYDYYAVSGNKYFDPTASAILAEALNEKFAFGITPEEIKPGVWDYGNQRRKQFGFDPAIHQNGPHDAFTPSVDPFTIAREAVANVLRRRGKSEAWILENFFTPLLPYIQQGADWEVKARAANEQRQRAEWKSLNPSIDTSWGSLFEDLFTNPVTLGMLAVASYGAFGAEALTGEVGAAGAVGESASIGALGSGTFGVEVAGVGAYGTTPAMAGALGSGLAETSLASIGLDAAALVGTSTASISTGATNMDSVSDWFSSYSSDPGPDPFATTADVNAGWSYDGGYPGVDWYNNAGIGEASAPASLNDIFSNVSKALKSATSILTSAQQLTAGQNRVQPNLTRSAGQMNLGLPLLLGAAYLAFRG